jgi:hypothetical protein
VNVALFVAYDYVEPQLTLVKNLQSCSQTRLATVLPYLTKNRTPILTMASDPRLRGRQQAASSAAPPPPPPPPTESNAMGMDGANDAHAEQNMVPDDSFKLKFCTVCASNQNRYVIP